MICMSQFLFAAMAALYLVDNVFIVADVIFKGHNRIPGIILGVKAAAGGLAVFMTRHSQRVPAEKQPISNSSSSHFFRPSTTLRYFNLETSNKF